MTDIVPLRLAAARTRPLVLAGLGLMAAAFGAVMIRDGQPSGWFVAGVFSLASLVQLIMLSSLRPALVADGDGLTLTSAWRIERIGWADILGFAVTGEGPGGRVVLALTPSRFANLKARILTKGDAGTLAMLPDRFGMTADALAGELEERRRRALAGIANSG